MKTIVIGLGNPILSDDGVGWKVIEKIQSIIPSSRLWHPSPNESPSGVLREEDRDEGEVVLETASLGGLSLMERLVGFERAILVDSMETGQGHAGSVRMFTLDELPNPSAGHSASAHDTSLVTALKTGRRMGLSLPTEIRVVAIEAKQVYDFSEELSPAVAAAVPIAAQAVLDILVKEKETV